MLSRWSLGIQREFKKDNVIEVRYVGNRGHKLWRQEDLNELNIVENGVYNEWKLAQQNLLANIAAGQGTTFKYRGPGTGTSPLPITLAYFSGWRITPRVAIRLTRQLHEREFLERNLLQHHEPAQSEPNRLWK